MLVSFLLSRLARPRAFSWTPSLDLSDRRVYSTLLPGAQI